MIFAVDSSGSIGPDNFAQLTSFVSKLAEALDLDGAMQDRGDGGRGGFRVGLLAFSSEVSVAFQLNTYTDKALLLQALQVGYVKGKTNTADAIRYTLLNLLSLHLVFVTEMDQIFQSQADPRSSLSCRILFQLV